MKYMVHLGPSDEFEAMVIAYREALGPTLRKFQELLHCTVMSFYAEERYEGRIREIVRSIANETRSFAWRTDRLELFHNSDLTRKDALVLTMERPDELLALHFRILRELAEYIDWNQTKPLAGLAAQAEERFKQFGSPFFGEAYGPHFSIGNVDGHEFPKISTWSWEVQELFLSKKEKGGEWHSTCTFPFAKPF